MGKRIFVTFILCLLATGARAGYQGYGKCFDSLGEAVTSIAYVFNGACGSGSCRILSYVPVTGAAQVIVGGMITTYTISSCSAAISPLDAGLVATPWYASDSGAVSACGSTVAASGGVSGSGGGSAQLVGWSMTPEDGAAIGISVAGMFVLAAIFRQLNKMGSDRADD